MEIGICDTVSRLLAYPSENIKELASECSRLVQSTGSPATKAIKGFSEYVDSSTVSDMQELYTRTFEINPICALEIGWQLFGERYERGTFIVKMRKTLRELNLPESSELPDHLIHVLQALDKLQPDEASEFASLFVVPAVDKMIKGFKDKKNVYRDVLDGLVSDVRNRYNLPEQGENNV